MDDRKKQIGELEQRKKEQIVLLDTLLTQFGEAFFGKITDAAGETASSFGELGVYRRFQNDITESETAIQAVEEQLRRFRELEESIEFKEREEGACLKELTIVYGRLGKLLLDAAASANGSATADGAPYAEFCAPYREQADALLTKVLSLEDRFAELEQKEGGNVFTWIGKSAQALVLRSFLTRAQENLEQLRRNVGERYSRRYSGVLPEGEAPDYPDFTREVSDIEDLCEDTQQKRAELQAVTRDLENLKEEKRKISGGFNADGGPIRQIQTLKNHISHVRDELKTLYRRVGAEAASFGASADEAPPERRLLFDSLIKPEDRETLDNADRISRSIRDAEATIEKIKASLAIDEEKAKIEKYRRMIQDRKDKITQAEKNITELEASIMDSETNIEKLQKLL